MLVEPIDLHHQAPGIVGSYLLETNDGPALFDCGPTTCIPHLKAGLAERGLDLTDIRHLLLSHIHLDHAGAAGVLVRQNPWLQVHVSEIGAPHIVDPSKLEASARRLYGIAFDALWGELAPVPAENVHVVGNRILGLDCFPTPGHASHHVSYLDAGGTLYAGDAAGVRLSSAHFVMPPCPPPEFDLEAWARSIRKIEERVPGRLALIHFGTFDDVEAHLSSLREILHSWCGRIEDGMDEPAFIAAARFDVSQTDPELVDDYDRAAPYWHHYQGSPGTGRNGARRSPQANPRVRLEVGERDELEGRSVRSLEHDGRRDTGLERFLPARRDDAPAIARLESGKQPLRLRGHEVVPRRHRELEELLRHDRADHVEPRSVPAVWQSPSRK